MKLFPILVFALIPALLQAQKIRVSEQDRFTKAYRIETVQTEIQHGFSSGWVNLSLRALDQTLYVCFSGIRNDMRPVELGAKAILLFEDGTTQVAESPSFQSPNTFTRSNVFEYYYQVSRQTVALLSKQTLAAVRLYAGQILVDIDLNKNQQQFKAVASDFLSEVDKHQAGGPASN